MFSRACMEVFEMFVGYFFVWLSYQGGTTAAKKRIYEDYEILEKDQLKAYATVLTWAISVPTIIFLLGFALDRKIPYHNLKFIYKVFLVLSISSSFGVYYTFLQANQQNRRKFN